MAAPKIAIVALAARVGLGRVEVGYALDGSLLDHGLCLLLAPVGSQHALPAQSHLSDGRARLSEEPRSNSHNNVYLAGRV